MNYETYQQHAIFELLITLIYQDQKKFISENNQIYDVIDYQKICIKKKFEEYIILLYHDNIIYTYTIYN